MSFRVFPGRTGVSSPASNRMRSELFTLINFRLAGQRNCREGEHLPKYPRVQAEGYRRSSANASSYAHLNPVPQDRACGATSESIEGTGLAFQATTDRVVARGAAWSPSHDGERHCSPCYVDRPAVRHGQFDDDCHEEKSQCCEASSQAKNKQDRKDYLAGSGQERENGWCRIRVGATRQMDHELVGEQRDGRVAEVEKA